MPHKNKQNREAYLQDYYSRPEVIKRARERSAEWYKNNQERVKKWRKENAWRNRGWYLKQKYNLSLEQYTKMKEAQNYKCAVCDLPQKADKDLAVDHCHATGKIRELLCDGCNNALGCVNDNIQILHKLINYLEKHNGNC